MLNFNGKGRGNDNRGRSGGRQYGQRDAGRTNGRFQARSMHASNDSEESFSFDINPNRVDTVRFVNMQRKLCNYVATRFPDVSKIFSHGTEADYTIPDPPVIRKGGDPFRYKRDQYREKVKFVMKRQEEYNVNKKLAYGILWKHCTLPLQNCIRSAEGFEDIERDEDVVRLWKEVKRLSTVGIVNNTDPEKLQRDADARFTRVRQLNYESVSMFYDRYLQEYCTA
jgi:hypothetical protein